MSSAGPALGCVADDFTGAVDVAAGTCAAGFGTVIVTNAHPSSRAAAADVVVVALKSRTAPVHDAVADSVAAAEALLELGCERLFFKFCSTFDSTPKGNIGPVADALAQLVGQSIIVVAPGYPAQERTVRGGQLYVGDQLLSESSMRHHPLTPMTSSDVPGLMAAQSRHPAGLIDLPIVRGGPHAVTRALARLARTGHRYAVVDTVTDADVTVLAEAVADDRLVTGSAALAHALAVRHGRPGRGAERRSPIPRGRRVVLSGSCSAATRRQVAAFPGPALCIDPRRIEAPVRAAADAARWVTSHAAAELLLITTTVDSDSLVTIHHEIGRENAAARVESFFAALAPLLLHAHGVDRMLIAGGETSGVITAALGVGELDVLAPISTGLAWCVSDKPGIALALKSGNFGADDVFSRAHAILDDLAPPAESPS